MKNVHMCTFKCAVNYAQVVTCTSVSVRTKHTIVLWKRRVETGTEVMAKSTEHSANIPRGIHVFNVTYTRINYNCRLES